MVAKGRRFHACLCALAVVAAFGVSACSSGASDQQTTRQQQAAAQFDLAKCETLEPSLYRCPGMDAPLCDPDFDRSAVQCVKVTKDGVLLQAFRSGTM